MPPSAPAMPTILSVDDSRTIRLMLARLFLPFACEFIEASNGEEGLAIALEKRPDLIITDCNMPVMDGMALLRRLRENPDLRHIPVIMLTSEPELENKATAARLGARDYISKPFRDDDLLGRVGRIISLRPRPEPASMTPPTSP